MMPLENLTIIGERINPGFASSKRLLDSSDLKGIQELAVKQVANGARYLTINVGVRAASDPIFIAGVIQAVQDVVDVPLAFDYPNAAVQEVCLKTYDPAKARDQKPIVNSISELRWEMFDVLDIQPARVVLMASERLEAGVAVPNTTAQDVALTAHRMCERILSNGHGLSADDLIIDVSLCPLATDTEGVVRRAVEAIGLIGADPVLKGVHQIVGLSNLGIMLPKQALDGGPISVRVESAFLTLTMPKGLDTILGTPGREYRMLPEDDFVFRGFREALALEGFDALDRVQQLYRN